MTTTKSQEMKVVKHGQPATPPSKDPGAVVPADDDSIESHHLAHGSAGFNMQFRTLFKKQVLLTRSRPVRTIIVFFLNGFIVQFFSSWGWLATVGGEDADLAGLFTLFLVVFWGIYALTIAEDLCTEKRERIREGMRMMGMADMPYYVSFFVFEMCIAFLYLIAGLIAAGIFVNVENPSSDFNDGVYVIEWAMAIFFLHLLTVSFSMMASAFFVSSQGSKVVFVIWACNVLPGIGSFTEPLDLGQGWRFLPGQYIVEMVARADGIPGNFWKCILEWVYSIIYITITFFLYCYLDQCIPHSEGRVRSWRFPFTSDFWHTVWNKEPVPTMAGIDGMQRANTLNTDVECEDDPALLAKAKNFQCVKTNDLEVVFTGVGGEKIQAVDKLNLTMYEDQIFVLLGHNGAGKTTTMHTLAGLLRPTAGQINAYGLQIPKDIDFVRKSFGFCPQHNQLWKNLSVKDHLDLYARLRGKKLTQEQFEEYVEEIGLTGKINAPAGTLSGGQKRKLSVGIAFIGDPKFVILDEPSSGMDTFARRQMWNFLKSRREGRVVMITTHFMDEADALADRVAVMAHGQLQAMGSPAFLKKRFGCGYMLVISSKDASGVGVLREKIVALVNKRAGSNEDLAFQTQGKEVVARMPFSCRDNLPVIMDDVEAMKNKGECSSYGLAVANLEEVFLKIADANHHQEIVESEVSAMNALKKRNSTGLVGPPKWTRSLALPSESNSILCSIVASSVVFVPRLSRLWPSLCRSRS
jgi:ABC-type multidrug transport system ATPase subunit